MGETARWAQNCLRIFKLSKSVNGNESIPAQKHLSHGLSRGGGGREKASMSGFPAGTNRNGKQPTHFLQILKNTESMTKVCKAVSQSESINLDSWISKKRLAEKNAGAEDAAGPSDINWG